jgi:3-methylfumaryl-CoA hydratase
MFNYMNIDLAALQGWVGRTETCSEAVTEYPARALAATLDDEPFGGGAQPPCWHWLHFLPLVRQSEIGPDGHPRRGGGLLPPVPLPRRMWAGSQIRFYRAPRVGQLASRTSTIADVSVRQGRSGPLVFVKILHQLRDAEAELLLAESQDIVYRGLPAAGEVAPEPLAGYGDPAWQRQIRPDPLLLFRFSALTFNGHRIHYDRDYAVGVEGYPGLVVHGPLVATLLLDLVRRKLPGASLRSFSFRALRPLFDASPLRLCGRPEPDGTVLRLWAEDAQGGLAMDAIAGLSS